MNLHGIAGCKTVDLCSGDTLVRYNQATGYPDRGFTWLPQSLQARAMTEPSDWPQHTPSIPLPVHHSCSSSHLIHQYVTSAFERG
jgi:hypothetical protein